jgi:aldehyde dehydrogenase (NAD+)
MPSLTSDMSNGGADLKKRYAATFERVDAARIDGRARNIRYRQKQLLAVHSFLLEKEDELVKAIQQDTGRSRRECQYEVSCTIDIVEKHYENLDFDAALLKEKNIARGVSATDWREPLGTVAIVCEARNPLNLAVSPLAGAIAAGNCAILIMVPAQSPSTFLFVKELSTILDNDAYALIQLPSLQDYNHDLLGPSVQCAILQSDSYISPKICVEVRPFNGYSCAIVDRSCKNIKRAAAQIAQAKFVYEGSSPFAPAFVLVHEAVKSEFLREFLAAISQYFPENIPIKDKDAFVRLTDIQSRLTSSKAGYGSVVMSGNGSGSEHQSVAPVVIEGDRRRGSELCVLVENKPILPIFSTRSLDDAIDYTATLLSGPALALYVFAGGADGSYLGQFIESKSVFINNIPQELAVGVAFPRSSSQADPLLRYTIEMLSVPKLFSVAQPGEKQERQFLGVKSHEPLRPPSQAPGKRLDFFLQGLAIGASGLLLLTSATLALSGWGIWKVIKR